MKFIRDQLDKIAPKFLKGGELEKLYPLYEAQDTFLFTPGEVTHGSTHVRDSLDLKRMMITVVIALIPCVIMAMYNTGYQASKIIEHTESAGLTADFSGWRYVVMDKIGVSYREAGTFGGNFLKPGLLFACLIHGALYFLPVYIVCMAAGGTAELIFSIVRKHEINEGFLVTGLLFPLTLPPTIPLWQVALGIIFGVVIGKEIFGGTGRNFLNPALTARAFLYFAYPLQITGVTTWAAVDGYSGATALGALADAKQQSATEVLSNLPVTFKGTEIISEQLTETQSFLNFFWGNVHGSMGETSAFCCLLGALILIGTGIGSWRIMVGCVIGLLGLSSLIWFSGAEDTLFNVPPYWHLVIGGFAFGTVFMATDPVSASMTDVGKWIYGILIGCLTIMVRVINPAFPEGIMLAILFGNVSAPLIDYWVVSQNIKRRLARNAA